ncbi:DNA internalization-related competence protein ComEC/Rec2 [Paenibacillus xerothermodurans]|uniref:DNA internalization-related competence protein ComEC/Rec2 n=1 Tax=Paenibacillus xerothermodurans TaxID=1977292 RepID=A0A2W1NHX6_PAEXE|nr:DNA internalization-related competence protein ComEC/Rec2 [Paenibacillus xerothermodurans]PZE22751.1 DNA internalization-related competence protein ComEC/Rec2 [Paenibacillus xerothermodurans]
MTRRPVVTFALLWAAGYALAYSYEWNWLSLYVALIAGIGAVLVWMLNIPGKAYTCGLLVMLIAACYFKEYDANNQTKLILNAFAASGAANAANNTTVVEGVITTRVEVDGDKAAFTFRSDNHDGELLAVSVKLLTEAEQAAAFNWQRADRLRLTGVLKQPETARNFGGFDYRNYLRLQHIHWQFAVKGINNVEPLSSQAWSLLDVLRWNDRFRAFLADGIASIFPQEQAGFMQSMLIGLTDDMDPAQFQRFSQLGLTHILAVSGLNVAIFLACLLWLMRRFGFTRETYLVTAMALLPVYIAVTGASPSIVRAGLMAIIALYAAYRHILKDGLHTVLLVGLVMLIWEPYYLMDVSFQLSFLVTIGLILGVPAVNKLLPLRSQTWKNALSITLVAQCVSFPVSIYYFNQFSLLSLAANLCLVPVFSLVTMPAGTAALIVGLVYIPAGKALAWLIAELNSWIFALVEVTSGWGIFQTIWPSPGIEWMIAYYLVCTAIVWGLLRSQAQRKGTAGPMLNLPARINPQIERWRAVWLQVRAPMSVLVLLILLGYGYTSENLWQHDGRVDFIDVGQGDSVLIRSPQSESVILIDGGGTLTFRKPGDEWKQRRDPYEVGRKLLVPLLKKRGVQTIDYMIVTHQDTDHIGGLQAVLEQIPVKHLVFNGTFKPGARVEQLFQTALDKQVKLVKAFAGDTLVADRHTTLHILHPQQADPTGALRSEQEQNEASVVFLMEMLGTRFLFTGDIDQAAEASIIHALANDEAQPKAAAQASQPAAAQREQTQTQQRQVDVLKVAHHGSKTSSSAQWLDFWRPSVAVMSVGAHNTYGHPSPQVVDRLEQREMEVLRTDLHGEVQMRIRDGTIRIRTKLSDRPTQPLG